MGIRVTCRPATRPKDRANRSPEGRLTIVYGVVPLMMFTEFSVENFQNADIPCQTNLQLSLIFLFLLVQFKSVRTVLLFSNNINV